MIYSFKILCKNIVIEVERKKLKKNIEKNILRINKGLDTEGVLKRSYKSANNLAPN